MAGIVWTKAGAGGTMRAVMRKIDLFMNPKLFLTLIINVVINMLGKKNT